ncbi:MAG: hypothetical protein FWG68_10245 [Defluviitaleaceae bacterium]|nr:hypothetical protein [Defluviitaleaceae bacterium]
MKKLKSIKILILATTMVIMYLVGVHSAGVIANAQPGTADDPLVSRSYVDRRIAELEALILQLETPAQPPEPPAPAPAAVNRELFEVIRANAGSILLGGASTEIILRAGEASVVAGPNGLANVTAGWDIMNGQAVPLNNLLIVPLDDGRGLRFHTDAYLMIKGDFTIIAS